MISLGLDLSVPTHARLFIRGKNDLFVEVLRSALTSGLFRFKVTSCVYREHCANALAKIKSPVKNRSTKRYNGILTLQHILMSTKVGHHLLGWIQKLK